MNKVLIQLLAIIVLFFGTWFVLSQVNWIKVLNVKQHTKRTEEKLGDLFWEMIKKTEKETSSRFAINAVKQIRNRICESNNIDSNKIKIHIIVKDDINAFALPNNHLVIFTGLIEACENEAELSGIIGHEIAHMEKNHLMKRLINEAGLSVLISMTTGNGNPELIKSMVKLLSTSAYDRNLETEADLTAVEYMINAGIDPEPMANFLFRLSTETNNLPSQFYWISTHPESEERAKAILETLKDRIISKKAVLSKDDWEQLKSKAKEKF